MKLFRSLCLTLATAVQLPARDLVPDHWIENVPATNDSIQTSLVFRTVAGVAYRVETSVDSLDDWTTDSEFYGMGHEFVVPMREFTAPPLPPPGEPPAELLPPASPVSLLLQPASGTEGGTVAAWKSLDHGGPVAVLLEEDLHEDWDSVPLYSQRFGNHYFFVFHPPHPAQPPSAATSLGPLDEAMLEQLEESLPAMNQEVATSAALARNAPPPAPPVPGSKKFWRIHADWSVDTDGDGSPDWAEFEMVRNSSHPDHSLANPFEGDGDGNGIPDGQQVDADEDGTADAVDIAVGDSLAKLQVGVLPRYALFSIQGVPATLEPEGVPRSPRQINDTGTVLYRDGTWRNGSWNLLAPTGAALTGCRAAGINDGGEIVGSGTLSIPDVGHQGVAVRWPDATSSPEPITAGTATAGNLAYATPTTGMAAGTLAPGPALSNDGHIIATTAKVEVEENGKKFNLKELALWTVAGPSRTAAYTPLTEAAKVATHVQDSNTYWGPIPNSENSDKTRVFAAGSTKELDSTPTNVVTPEGGFPNALTQGRAPLVLKDGEWNPSLSMFHGLDMSKDGTVISDRSGAKAEVIRLNGKWNPLSVVTPGATTWHGDGVSLLDTSSGGWILARRMENDAPLHAALLPLRVQGNLHVDETLLTEGVGVDDFSIGSSQPGQAVQDKIWIMAPLGEGETKVKVTAPLAPDCPVELSGAGLKFNGNPSITLNAKVTEFTFKAEGEIASGSEIPLVMTLGTGDTAVQSLSSPVAAKVMKRRTVRIRVWIVKADNGNLPGFNPTKEQLEAYLNKIFQPQINAVFECSLQPIGPFGYDTATGTDFGAPQSHDDAVAAGNGALDFTATAYGGEMSTIRVGGNYVNTFNLNMYIVGGAHWIAGHQWKAEENKLVTQKAGGAADIQDDNEPRAIWLAGESTSLEEGLSRAAHEVGHFLFGQGHPESYKDDSTDIGDTGPAPLPGTPRPPRLMCSDPKLGAIGGLKRLTVKGEWDKATEWFTKEINADRMDDE